MTLEETLQRFAVLKGQMGVYGRWGFIRSCKLFERSGDSWLLQRLCPIAALYHAQTGIARHSRHAYEIAEELGIAGNHAAQIISAADNNNDDDSVRARLLAVLGLEEMNEQAAREEEASWE